MLLSFLLVSFLLILYAHSRSILPSYYQLRMYTIFAWNLAKYMVNSKYRLYKRRLIEHYITSNVEVLSNGNLSVAFNRKGVEYRVLIQDGDRGFKHPSNVMIVYDDKENDVTNDVTQYMGWKNNFFGMKYTPSMLGYKSLSFELTTGQTLVFNENDVISLTGLIS